MLSFKQALQKAQSVSAEYLSKNEKRLSNPFYLPSDPGKSQLHADYIPVAEELKKLMGELSSQHIEMPISAELSALFGLSVVHCEFSALYNQVTKLQQERMLHENRAASQLQRLQEYEDALIDAAVRYSGCFEKLGAECFGFLQTIPALAELLQALSANSSREAKKSIVCDLEPIRLGFQKIICDERFQQLSQLNIISGNTALRNQQAQEKRRALLTEMFPGKNTLLHIAAAAGHLDLARLVLSHAQACELNMNAVNKDDVVALQFPVNKQDKLMIDAFLQYHPNVKLLRTPDGQELVRSLPKITSLKLLPMILQLPLSALILYHFIHGFYDPEALQRKMVWLLNYSGYVKHIQEYLEIENADVREFLETIFYVHKKCEPIRQRLSEILELRELYPVADEGITAVFVTEAADFNSKKDANLSGKKLLMLNALIDQFAQFMLKAGTITMLPDSLRSAVTALCRYNSGFIEDLINYLHGQQVNHTVYQKNSPTYWETNVRAARKGALENDLNQCVHRIQIVITNSCMKWVTNNRNRYDLEKNYLLPLLYANDSNQVHKGLDALEKDWHLTKNEMTQAWLKIRDDITKMVSMVTVLERQQRYFGPVLARLHIETLIQDTHETFSGKSCYQEIMTMIHTILCVPTTTESEALLPELRELLMREDSDLAKLWQNLEADIQCFVLSVKVGDRTTGFKKLAAQIEETSQNAFSPK